MRMRRVTIAVIVLVLTLILSAACRSKKQPQPEPVPPITQSTAPDTPVTRVEPPSNDFPATTQPSEEALSADFAEATRQAHERGYLRDAFFGFDAATLDSDAQSALAQTAKWLREHSEYRIRIEGHCDDRGTEQYNLALGDRRAGAAASYLETLGIERDRVELVSYGEQRPFEEGESEEARAQNRRAHIVIAGRR
jgi:peptidoglycan-associated lipoprotein